MYNIDGVYDAICIKENKLFYKLNSLYNNWGKEKIYSKKFFEYKKETDGYKGYIISIKDKIKRYFYKKEIEQLKKNDIELYFV